MLSFTRVETTNQLKQEASVLVTEPISLEKEGFLSSFYSDNKKKFTDKYLPKIKRWTSQLEMTYTYAFLCNKLSHKLYIVCALMLFITDRSVLLNSIKLKFIRF